MYQGCCDHSHGIEDINLADDLNSILDEMVLAVYNMQGTDGSVNEAVTKFIADKIWSGVVKGFGGDLDSFDYDTPDYNMLKALKENVWQFSSAKNYAQLRELSDALLDQEGRLRSFEQFRELARAINDKYMKTWLKTEYNLAINGAQMASKWVRISADAGVLPLLQFDAVLDTQTTDLCRSLDGTILPVDHPFWNRFYPPNHFNCRSTVRQLPPGAAVTQEDKIPSAVIPPMFQVNLGKRGLIFPTDHPYFVDIPDAVLNMRNGAA